MSLPKEGKDICPKCKRYDRMEIDGYGLSPHEATNDEDMQIRCHRCMIEWVWDGKILRYINYHSFLSFDGYSIFEIIKNERWQPKQVIRTVQEPRNCRLGWLLDMLFPLPTTGKQVIIQPLKLDRDVIIRKVMNNKEGTYEKERVFWKKPK